MTTPPTSLEWAHTLGDTIATALHDAGLHNDGDKAPVIIGNPIVADSPDECGFVVLIDYGPRYRTQEPWPSPREDITYAAKSVDATGGAQEFSVSVRFCVLSEDDEGRDETVVDAAEVLDAMWNGLWCAIEVGREGVKPWTTAPGKGRVFVDQIEPVPQEGRFAMWRASRVVVPVCVDCPT